MRMLPQGDEMEQAQGAPAPRMAPPSRPLTSPAPTQSPTIQAAAPGQAGLAPMTPPAPQPPTPAPATPSVAPATAPAMTPPSVAPAIPGAATSGFGPGNDLRTTQIAPSTSPRLAGTQGMVDAQAGKLASGPDRFQLAQDRFKTYADQTDPAFQASIRAATQNAAANGAIGSGMLGTTYGDLGLQRSRDLQAERDTLFGNALEGTIGDTRANVGLLAGLEGQQYGQDAQSRNELRGERGYQNGMEQQAYDRGIQGLTLEDALTNSAFGRGQAQEQAGEANNPANTQLLLSGIYGDQAKGAGQALAGLVQNTATNNALKGPYGQPVPPPDLSGNLPGFTPPNVDDLLASVYGGGR